MNLNYGVYVCAGWGQGRGFQTNQKPFSVCVCVCVGGGGGYISEGMQLEKHTCEFQHFYAMQTTCK